ncbi:MAG TPA: DNA-processing protein DprA [Aggregatilineaceae bacterium]|nr:DNA-processing protein DprA [Aggregatilineaceae bacterium]
MTDDRSLALAQWVALSLIPSLGSRRIGALLDHFGSLVAILEAGDSDLRAVPGIGPKLAAAIRAIDLAQTASEIAGWQADGIAILLRGDAGYPAALKTLTDAPPILFRCGLAGSDDSRAVAIVGTRSPAGASRRLAETIAGTLAGQGWTVTSGMSAGIDTAAHQGALRAGGRTLAVLGCGVRVIYPPENAPLAAHILAQGALLSETHPDMPPSSPTLVARNRLISGLSRAVIVIETAEDGGGMYTARFAREQERIVYAVQNGSAGNVRLIAEGAHPLPPHAATWDWLSNDLFALG